MRVLVCGGRKFKDISYVYQILDTYDISYLIVGDAIGVDTFAVSWATERNVPHKIFEANWDNYDNDAGPIRNEQMLIEGKPDLIIAFKGGPGTQNMVYQAAKARIEVIRV